MMDDVMKYFEERLRERLFSEPGVAVEWPDDVDLLRYNIDLNAEPSPERAAMADADVRARLMGWFGLMIKPAAPVAGGGDILDLTAVAKLLRVSRPWLRTWGSSLPFMRGEYALESELRDWMNAPSGRFIKPREAAKLLRCDPRWITRNCERLKLGKRLALGMVRLSDAGVRAYRDSLRLTATGDSATRASS
jgi:hypothetical protein